MRPAPSLRILFTSPSLRVPGILQSPFLSRIGGSPRVRADLSQALGEGRGVTAKIRWLTRADDSGEGEGRSRWIHCTPLLGHSGAVGVWMVVLVDEEGVGAGEGRRRFRPAPPVANIIGGKEYEHGSRAQRDVAGRPLGPARSGSALSTARSWVQSPGVETAGDRGVRFEDSQQIGYFSNGTHGSTAASKARQQHIAALQQDRQRPRSAMSGNGGARSVDEFALK